MTKRKTFSREFKLEAIRLMESGQKKSSEGYASSSAIAQALTVDWTLRVPVYGYPDLSTVLTSRWLARSVLELRESSFRISVHRHRGDPPR
jgi:hypothetical protein